MMPPMSLRQKRYKVNVACELCRRRKVKCDGVRPACGNCRKKQTLRESCNYREPQSDGLAGREHSDVSAQNIDNLLHSLHIPPPLDQEWSSSSSLHPSDRGQTASTPTSSQTPNFDTSYSNHREEQVSTDTYGNVSNQAFTKELKAAVEARLGLPAGGFPGLTSVTNAPFFSAAQINRGTTAIRDQDFVIPPRSHADQLVNIFWRHVHPLEPLLDKDHFQSCYAAFFAGTLDSAYERVFYEIVNVVFALATQLHESIDPMQRDQTSSTYFQRAWNSLHRSNAMIWEEPCLGLVQCLLLMGSYLKCANDAHQTCMIAGLAFLVAQSLGLHRLDPLPGPCNNELRRQRQVWLACIYLDRQFSMTYGRSALVPKTQALLAIDVCRKDIETISNSPTSEYLISLVELFEITNSAVPLLYDQTSTPSNFAERVGLSKLERDREACEIALHFDTCLSKWEQGLPPYLQPGAHHSSKNECHKKQAVALRLRTAHSRMILSRPLLVRFCLSGSSESTNSRPDQGLAPRLVRECAYLCVSNAQSIITLISDHHKEEVSHSLLPAWWYRVYYTHIAATVLIAAKLHPDLSVQFEVLQAWERAISILQAHKHLSPFIPQSITVLHNISSKVWETHNVVVSGDDAIPDGHPNAFMEDIFRDIGFDPNNPAFGPEDMYWVNDFS